MINIGLCTDERYAMPCTVCITSIFENNKKNKINIHLLTKQLKKKTEKIIQNIALQYNQQITIYPINSDSFDGLPTSDRYPMSIYFRLLYPNIIPENISTLLYLDCDTIVLKDISGLYNTQLGDCICGVVEDHFSDDIRNKNRIEKYDDYFNTGVLLLNLDVWRKQDISKKCIQYMHDYPEKCLYPDQDALNIVLNNHIFWLDTIYNYQEGFFYKKYQLLLHKSKWHKIDRSLNEIAILHYSFSEKPWHKECNHPYKSLFINYKNMTCWKNCPTIFYEKKILSICLYYYRRLIYKNETIVKRL